MHLKFGHHDQAVRVSILPALDPQSQRTLACVLPGMICSGDSRDRADRAAEQRPRLPHARAQPALQRCAVSGASGLLLPSMPFGFVVLTDYRCLWCAVRVQRKPEQRQPAAAVRPALHGLAPVCCFRAKHLVPANAQDLVVVRVWLCGRCVTTLAGAAAKGQKAREVYQEKKAAAEAAGDETMV